MTPTKAFSVLGLERSASPAEVKSRYRELALTNHPDRGGDATKFDTIVKAYRVAAEHAAKPLECSACGGDGKVGKGKGFTKVFMPCAKCAGTGRMPRE